MLPINQIGWGFLNESDFIDLYGKDTDPEVLTLVNLVKSSKMTFLYAISSDPQEN